MELNKIFNGDSMDLIKNIENNSIDLVVLDPNYQDWDILCERGIIKESIRVLKPTGNIVCFTKQPFDYNLRNEVNHIFKHEIIWSFSNGGAWVSRRLPLTYFQKIYWLVLSKEYYFNPRTGLQYKENTKNAKRTKKVFSGYEEEGRYFEKSEAGTWLKDFYHFNKPHGGKIPKKPSELLGVFINCLCPENGIVLDPFLGSGEAIIQSINLNRRFIGFEIDGENFKLAHNRVEQVLQKYTLFKNSI